MGIHSSVLMLPTSTKDGSRASWPNAQGAFAAVTVLLLASCWGSGTGPNGTLSVISVSPSRNALTASASGEVVVRFDRALDVRTVHDGDLLMFGRWSGVSTATAALEDGARTLRFHISEPLSAGESVTATIPAGAIRARDGTRSLAGYTWSFWTDASPTTMTFQHTATVPVRRPGEGRIQTYGAYAGDLDGDGWSDLIVPNEQSNDLRVFLNDGAGGYSDFTVVPIPDANRPSTNEGADFDGDGDIDFAVGSARGTHVAVFHGDGAGGLVHRQNLDAGERVRGVCLLDLEGDGDQDLVATAFEADQVAVFENDGLGAFTRTSTIDAGAGEWSCATGDMNGDGLTDLSVGTRNGLEVSVLLSDGRGGFTLASQTSAGGDPWMLSAGDMNGDGHLDLVAVNTAAKSVTVFLGDGQGGVTLDDSYPLDGFPLAVDLGDLDGDGDLDVVTSDFQTGMFVIHENLSDGRLVRVATPLMAPSAASCAILHDRDNDGDLDITGIDEVEDLLILLENQ